MTETRRPVAPGWARMPTLPSIGWFGGHLDVLHNGNSRVAFFRIRCDDNSEGPRVLRQKPKVQVQLSPLRSAIFAPCGPALH